MNRILIVEDERPIADLIEMTLMQAGYQCDIALDGVTAADIIEQNRHDLIIMDIMLPGANGYELIEYVAGAVPVIFLTAKSAVSDRVKGLRMGADDYIVKPFEPPELVARVETVLRRLGKGSAEINAFGISVDTVARTVRRMEDGQPVQLTPREFDLLEILLRNRGVALYREVLFERAWGASRRATPARLTCTSSACAKNWAGKTISAPSTKSDIFWRRTNEVFGQAVAGHHRAVGHLPLGRRIFAHPPKLCRRPGKHRPAKHQPTPAGKICPRG